jgi:hypothetical protein
MTTLAKALTGLLKLSLRPSGRVSRFMLDTYITPSLYLSLNSLIVSNPAVSLDEFESTLLPVMHPNTRRSVPLKDLENNLRFRAWVRNAFLRKRYSKASGSQSQSWWKNAEALMLRPNELPSHQQVVNMFDLQSWDRSKDADEDVERNKLLSVLKTKDTTPAAEQTKNKTPTVEQGAAEPPLQLANWNMEHVLEAMGCCVHGMNEFNVICEQHGIYDALTSDYIQALSRHILQSAHAIKNSRARLQGPLGGRPIVILEIGAGSGRLSHFLRESIQDRSSWASNSDGASANGRQQQRNQRQRGSQTSDASAEGKHS